ncbi:MAG: hypothetical protein JSV03_06345 [Planctomycetota bacterium]|nr:MAG: hypothetical protein JSV03_06345 [Planctomycetota bacterium]
MKKTRRQELKTNELSIMLKQMYEAILRYSNYMIGGALVVVLVLVIGMIYNQNRRNARRNAWNEYREIQQLDITVDPGLIDRARILAGEFSSDRNLGPATLELEASLHYKLAMSLTSPSDRADRIDHYNEAKSMYQQLIEKYNTRPEVVNRAHMSLAAIEESLLIMGESTIDMVREHYQYLAAADKSTFKSVAEDLLDSLEERIAKVEIVATRPAETPTTQARAPATQPQKPKQRIEVKMVDIPSTAPATSTTPAD